MVTRFATSPPTDNCPQPKEAQPLSQLDIRLIQHLDSSALWSDGPEVALILHYPAPWTPQTTVVDVASMRHLHPGTSHPKRARPTAAASDVTTVDIAEFYPQQDVSGGTVVVRSPFSTAGTVDLK
jgi:hypothetical protein